MEQAKEDKIKVVESSLTETQEKLSTQTQNNKALKAELDTKSDALQSLENRYKSITGELEQAQSTVVAVTTEANEAKKTIADQDKRITELSTERDALTGQMTELNSNME
ncbi:hypothetical protein OAH08_05505, partial [Verrucomicrobia bacterium]|nr:hypothetical protein [Verrucomicrobiota bacterium]